MSAEVRERWLLQTAVCDICLCECVGFKAERPSAILVKSTYITRFYAGQTHIQCSTIRLLPRTAVRNATISLTLPILVVSIASLLVQLVHRSFTRLNLGSWILNLEIRATACSLFTFRSCQALTISAMPSNASDQVIDLTGFDDLPLAPPQGTRFISRKSQPPHTCICLHPPNTALRTTSFSNSSTDRSPIVIPPDPPENPQRSFFSFHNVPPEPRTAASENNQDDEVQITSWNSRTSGVSDQALFDPAHFHPRNASTTAANSRSHPRSSILSTSIAALLTAPSLRESSQTSTSRTRTLAMDRSIAACFELNSRLEDPVAALYARAPVEKVTSSVASERFDVNVNATSKL